MNNVSVSAISGPLPGGQEPSATTATDATGSFTLASLSAGSQTITFTLSGYSEASATANVTAGSITNIGAVSLSPNPTTGIIKGTVTDSSGGQPLSGVTITLEGSFTGSIITGNDGSFIFTNVAPGSITITTSKTGYNAVAGTGTVTVGGMLVFSPQLSATQPLPTTGTVIGKVVDALTNQPLGGVSVISSQLSATTTDTGAFTLSNVPSGNQTITFSLTGYATALASVNIAAGAINNLGDIFLSANPTTGIIKGTVTDEANGQPLSGVTITLTGSFSGTTATGTDGMFIFTNVPTGSVTLAASKTGFDPVTGTGTITAGGILFFNIKMNTTSPLPTTGNLTGKVYDGFTNKPIQGAAISVSGGASISADTQGIFLINDITPGTYQITISASGYTSQGYQVMILQGTTTDMQTIYLTPSPQSTTITGTVADASTGNPIANADVSIIEANSTIKTDSSGTYSFSFTGISLLEFTVKASATGYDSLQYTVTTAAYGTYTIDLALNQSQVSNIKITSLTTDKQSYPVDSFVAIAATLMNSGSIASNVVVNARIINQQGVILDVLPPPQSQITVNPQSSADIPLEWNTAQHSQGTYRIILAVNDLAQGILLDEKEITFSIEPAFSLTGAFLNATPTFTYTGKTETVKLSSSLSYVSNISMDMSALYTFKDPQNNILDQGTILISLPAADATIYRALAQITRAFATAQHSFSVIFSRNGIILKEVTTNFGVLSNIRINTQRSVTPLTVLPEATGKVKIIIELKGVEQ